MNAQPREKNDNVTEQRAKELEDEGRRPQRTSTKHFDDVVNVDPKFWTLLLR